MNKKEKTGTNHTRFLKWHKALILAFAATLSFHYQPTIEAMESETFSETYDLINAHINELRQKIAELEKTIPADTFKQNTDDLDEQEIVDTSISETLNKHTYDLAKVLKVSTKSMGHWMKQDTIQTNINKALNQTEIKIELPEGITQEDLYFDLKGNQETLQALQQYISDEKLKQQIKELIKSYQKITRHISLSSCELALKQLTDPSNIIDIEENENNNQPSDADINNITRLATFYLANMLYIDIEENNSSKTNQTKPTQEKYSEKIQQHQQQTQKLLNSYMAKEEPDSDALSELQGPKYKITEQLQEEIQQQIPFLSEREFPNLGIPILQKQITQLHIILKLLFAIKQDKPNIENNNSINNTITIYQNTLRKITPRNLEFITPIIKEEPKDKTEEPKYKFEKISLTKQDYIAIQHLTQNITGQLIQAFTKSLSEYKGEGTRDNNKELLKPKQAPLKTNDSVKKQDKQPPLQEQSITENIDQLTELIIKELDSIISQQQTYLGIECTIIYLRNHLQKLKKQNEEAAKQPAEHPETTTERKNELAKQAIETIINFLHIMEQTADEGAKQNEIKQLVAAYSSIGTLLQKQQDERKKQEEEKQRTEEAIITNLKSTTDKLSKIINILLQ